MHVHVPCPQHRTTLNIRRSRIAYVYIYDTGTGFKPASLRYLGASEISVTDLATHASMLCAAAKTLYSCTTVCLQRQHRAERPAVSVECYAMQLEELVAYAPLVCVCTKAMAHVIYAIVSRLNRTLARSLAGSSSSSALNLPAGPQPPPASCSG